MPCGFTVIIDQAQARWCALAVRSHAGLTMFPFWCSTASSSRGFSLRGFTSLLLARSRRGTLAMISSPAPHSLRGSLSAPELVAGAMWVLEG